MWQQGHWSACLEGGTFEVEVKPGRIAYVGTLHTDLILTDLQRQPSPRERVPLRGGA